VKIPALRQSAHPQLAPTLDPRELLASQVDIFQGRRLIDRILNRQLGQTVCTRLHACGARIISRR
jgi:hypothetical protein